MRAAFLGTPDEAVPILAAVGDVADVTVVITRPDAPRGRSGRPVPPPVKVSAEERGWRVEQPERAAEIGPLVADADVAVVAAFGRLIPGPVLAVPPAGFVNVHFSLLPRWRGASPVVRAILAGDGETGVTLMQMDEGLDTGPMFAWAATRVDPEEPAGTLTDRLAGMGADLVRSRLGEVVAGSLRPVPQDGTRATAAGKVTVEEAFLDPGRHRKEPVVRAVRAFNPRPGAWGIVGGERIKVWRARPGAGVVSPGTAILQGGAVLLGVADGVVELVEVQPTGRPVMSAVAWMNGRRGAPAVFGSAGGAR
ncbi:MAG TPA: methionyl-tRNA formyltransferase [Acidimicrobiia bacterium]|nr:methionyl-tRNA formyltransferase [Acidimicrobiia bacterium]